MSTPCYTARQHDDSNHDLFLVAARSNVKDV
jgi:hypothetical protein